MTTLFDDAPPDFSQCGSPGARAIIYGDPSEEMIVAARLGDIVLGGVPREGHTPQWLCACGARY